MYEFRIKEYEIEISVRKLKNWNSEMNKWVFFYKKVEEKKDQEMISLRTAYNKMEEVLSKYKKKRMEDQLTIHQLTQELHGRKTRLQACASNDCLIVENLKRKSSPDSLI